MVSSGALVLLTYCVRILHVIAAMAWVGFSFHTRRLELRMKRAGNAPEGALGEVWDTHTLGYYRTTKYLKPPAHTIQKLVWFTWQIKTTWLTGFLMLALIYYRGATLYLADSSKFDLATGDAVLISIVGLVVSTAIYTMLYRSPLAKNEPAIVFTQFVMIVIASALYNSIFSARGSMMQIGATMATFISYNIVFVLFPTSRRMVDALAEGRDISLFEIGAWSQRSRHNNYMILPVIILMMVGHFPLFQADASTPIVVALIIVSGAAARRALDQYHEHARFRVLPISIATITAVTVMALCAPGVGGANDKVALRHSAAVPLNAPTGGMPIRQIMIDRCMKCHADHPTWPGVSFAPKNVKFESDEDISRYAGEIERVAVNSRQMPPGNVTQMTEQERRQLADWIGKRFNRLAAR